MVTVAWLRYTRNRWWSCRDQARNVNRQTAEMLRSVYAEIVAQSGSDRWRNAMLQKQGFEGCVALGQLRNGLSEDPFSFLSSLAEQSASSSVRCSRAGANGRRGLSLCVHTRIRQSLSLFLALALDICLACVKATSLTRIVGWDLRRA